MLKYVLSLARQNTDAIGFIPEPKLRQYAERGQIWIETENGDPCGFLVFGNGWPTLRIYQACIQMDARRKEHGIALVGRLIAKAAKYGYEAVSCWCAEDLESNAFWRECGFTWSGTRDGGVRRGRKLNQWTFWLPSPRQGRLFRAAERNDLS